MSIIHCEEWIFFEFNIDRTFCWELKNQIKLINFSPKMPHLLKTIYSIFLYVSGSFLHCNVAKHCVLMKVIIECENIFLLLLRTAVCNRNLFFYFWNLFHHQRKVKFAFFLSWSWQNILILNQTRLILRVILHSKFYLQWSLVRSRIMTV